MRILIAILACTAAVFGQEALPAPKLLYEVASVKRHDPADPRKSGKLEKSGRLVLVNTPLRELIRMSFQSGKYASTGDAEVAGLPPWASETVDVDARPPEGFIPTTDQHREMFRALIEDRFQVKVRVELKDQAVYHLVQAKGKTPGTPGFKLSEDQTPFDGDYAPPPGKGVSTNVPGLLRAKGLQMEQVAMYVSGWPGRRVLDKTGLKGVYDVELQFTPANMSPVAPGTKLPSGGTMPAGDYPSIFTAIEEQWGLKLEPAMAPAEKIVVERIEKLIEN